MSSGEAGVIFKSRKNRANVRKRPATEEEDDDLASAMDEREAIQRAKMQKQAPNTFSTQDTAKQKSVKLLHESDRMLQQATDQGATREVETETAKDRDARYAKFLDMKESILIQKALICLLLQGAFSFMKP